ncbi:MAG TPA: endonuclease/exonuclease/phosphatase family protein, partial [Mycobacteriales bacterium]|nr:endonuclease/exonuclease/phosphatase family protein [Mycobacteriales bacterium]
SPGVRVATANLLHGVSPSDGRCDLTRLRAAVAAVDADALALQEVDVRQPRSGLVDQAAEAAAAAGAADWRFVPVLGDGAGAGGGYGIALLLRVPVREWRVLPLGRARLPAPIWLPVERRFVPALDEPRVAVAALLDGMSVVATHLSFVPGANVRQLRRLTGWAAQLPGPVLLLGDLNLPGALPQLIAGPGWRALGRLPTYPTLRPRVQFDHVLAHGPLPAVCAVASIPLPVSDHRALVVTLQ